MIQARSRMAKEVLVMEVMSGVQDVTTAHSPGPVRTCRRSTFSGGASRPLRSMGSAQVWCMWHCSGATSSVPAGAGTLPLTPSQEAPGRAAPSACASA